MKLTVNIPRRVYDKIMYFVDKAPFEVSGMGTVVYNRITREFDVEEVWLVDQEVGPAHTDIKEQDLMKLMYELHKSGCKGTLNFWWHSHVNMDVFWSSQDKDTMKELAQNGYCVATVFNKKHEMRTAYTSMVEGGEIIGRTTHMIDDVKTMITDYWPAEQVEEWDKSYVAKVKEKVYQSYSQFGHQDWKSDEWWMRDKDPTIPAPNMTPNILDATRPKNNYPTFADEAKYLGLTKKQYKRLLNEAGPEKLEQIERDLEPFYKTFNWGDNDLPKVGI